MTLFKLSIRNAKRQAQDYLVYFVTIILAAALVYAFNGLVFSQEILTLSSMLSSLPLVIVLSSIVVVCIIGWLVQYTTRFMLSRRSRELGTYILIGLENRQVAKLFFWENLVVGSIALILGTFLGNLLFQALRAITLSLFHVPYTFSFAFSLKALGLTIFYFSLVYLFALVSSHHRICTMKINELIYYDRQNQGEVIKKSQHRRKIFTISIVLGILGTILLLFRNLALGILGAIFIIIFLYGFFISFSSGVPAYFDKRPVQKYKGHHLLIFRSLSSKLATMGIVMATIALLFTATLLSEGSGMLFHAMFQSRASQTTCYDLFIGSTGQEANQFDDYLAYIGANIPVEKSMQYHIYQAENMQITQYLDENTDYYYFNDYDTLMRASDYAALRAMLEYPEVSIEPGTYLIHCMSYLEKSMQQYSDPIVVDTHTLKPGNVCTEIFTQSLWDGNGRGFILVVPDEIAEARPISHSIYAAMTAEPVPEQKFRVITAIRDKKDSTIAGYDTIFAKSMVEKENAAMYAVIVFPLYYLALVLTMVSATILTIQQLSETNRYQRQFSLLDKLGMDRREMRQTLYRQFAIYYTMPALPPILISIPFLVALGKAFSPGDLNGTGHLLSIIGATLGLFFCIYSIYILMAFTSLKRNALPPS